MHYWKIVKIIKYIKGIQIFINIAKFSKDSTSTSRSASAYGYLQFTILKFYYIYKYLR